MSTSLLFYLSLPPSFLLHVGLIKIPIESHVGKIQNMEFMVSRDRTEL